MIKVHGRDPGILPRNMDHHAPKLIPIAQAFATALLLSSFGSDDEEHTIRQHGKGANSFSFTNAHNGRQYHFRSYDGYETVEVRNSYREGTTIARAATSEEAWAIVARIDAGAL